MSGMVIVPRGAVKQIVGRLKMVYKATGGEKDFEKEERRMFEQAVGTWDARKVLIAQKLEFVRAKINERDDLVKKKKSGTQTIRLSNDIKKMVKFVRKDFEEMKKMHESGLKGSIFRAKIKPEELRERESDLDLLGKHVREVELLDKRRFQSTGGEGDNAQARKELLGSDGAQNGDQSTTAPLLENMGSDQGLELHEDARDTNLPKLNIDKSLAACQQFRKQLDEGLDALSLQVSKLNEIATNIGDSVDRQNTLLDNMEKKVDKQTEVIDHLNERVEDMITKVSQSGRMACILILLVVVALLVCAVVVYIALSI